MTFFDKYQDDLICILFNWLIIIAETCKDLFLEMIQALDKLLLLDEKYPDELLESDSVKSLIESYSGFEMIEKL